jgi:thymidylate synthase (FAD)
VRHRSFAFQEFSQRYANPKEMGDMFVMREARLQDEKNRQNSVKLDLENTDHIALLDKWEEMQQNVIYAASQAYNWAIKVGIAKEQARAVLPEGLTKTRLYMNGTLRSWIHYIELRGANGTQKEHMIIAHACAEIIAKIFPLVKEL